VPQQANSTGNRRRQRPTGSRALQDVLYRSAKQNPERRFHALYDKVARSDMLARAWADVAANRGAPGVDGISIADIQAGGADGVRAFLEELADQLRAHTYRPAPLRRAHIPKPGKPGQTRPLGIPTVADRVVMAAAKAVLEPSSRPTSGHQASGSARSSPPTKPWRPSGWRPTGDSCGCSTPTSKPASTKSTTKP
jgi:retron-type reverse transcriptase